MSGSVIRAGVTRRFGWLPAAVWAFFAINNYNAERREFDFRRQFGRN